MGLDAYNICVHMYRTTGSNDNSYEGNGRNVRDIHHPTTMALYYNNLTVGEKGHVMLDCKCCSAKLSV
jgi:hypothetical protein